MGHHKFNITGKDLWFTEADDIRLVDASEMLEAMNVSSDSFDIPSHGSKRC